MMIHLETFVISQYVLSTFPDDKQQLETVSVLILILFNISIRMFILLLFYHFVHSLDFQAEIAGVSNVY